MREANKYGGAVAANMNRRKQLQDKNSTYPGSVLTEGVVWIV